MVCELNLSDLGFGLPGITSNAVGVNAEAARQHHQSRFQKERQGVMAMPGMGIVTLENPDYWISNCGGKAYRILNHGPGSVHLKHTDSVTDSFESSQGGVKIVIAANQR